jgi:peptidoglycan hydrolase-like protein with peptidoglycan-binding domain
MRKFLYTLVTVLFLSLAVFAQETTKPAEKTETKAKRPPIFRANKEQVKQAQKMLKVEETGKLDDTSREAIKTFQSANGLKDTGTLNRATLEKMKIELTDKQKAMPVSPNSFEKGKSEKMSKDSKNSKEKSEKTSDEDKDKKPKKAIFRANKEQVMTVQKMLKVEETGKLDDTTRDAIKKYQESNGVKITGTLNKETLVKMGVELTDKQKEM